ncbi:MAG: winged helix-turn-helix transcriptional regulator [Candidatus Ranarchaeia archaeon]
MSDSKVKTNEIKLLKSLNQTSFVGKPVGEISTLTGLTKPTVSRTIHNMVNNLGLCFPIQIVYPKLDLRLVRIVFSTTKDHTPKALHILKTEPLINLQHIMGGFQETYLATFAIDLDNISQLHKVFRQLKSWRWVSEYRLFIIRETSYSYNLENYSKNTKKWNIPWQALKSFLFKSLDGSEINLKYLSEVSKINYQTSKQNGEPIPFDKIDIKLLNTLSKTRWQTYTHISKEIKLSQVAIANRIRRLSEKGIFSTYTDFDETKIGLTNHTILIIEYSDNKTLESISSIMKLLPRTKIYKTDDGLLPGLIIEADLPGEDSTILPSILIENLSQSKIATGKIAWFNSNPHPSFSYKKWKGLPSEDNYYNHKKSYGIWSFGNRIFSQRLSEVSGKTASMLVY